MVEIRPFDVGRFARTTAEIYSLDEFRSLLEEGRQLRIKYGVDVTAPFLHIGHAVNLWMMRELQEHGHRVVFLIGDFTTTIGDPTDQEETRGRISDAEITRNAEGFIKQVSRILMTDDEVFEVRRNSEWYSEMPLRDLFELLSTVTYSRLIDRDMFQQRIAEGRHIYVHELLYPVLQGYDSFALNSDLTIVGTDQLFNELMGRHFQERLGQDPQVVLTTRITPGVDGRKKQSKSLGNYIALDDSPREMFGKVMSLPDDLIVPYMEVYTEIPLARVRDVESAMEDADLNPMEAKRELGRALVARYHGSGVAEAEDEWFMETFSKGETPEDVPVVRVEAGSSLWEALRVAYPDRSNSSLRRLIEQGAVRRDEEKLLDPQMEVSEDLDDEVLRVGRREWVRVSLGEARTTE